MHSAYVEYKYKYLGSLNISAFSLNMIQHHIFFFGKINLCCLYSSLFLSQSPFLLELLDQFTFCFIPNIQFIGFEKQKQYYQVSRLAYEESCRSQYCDPFCRS